MSEEVKTAAPVARPLKQSRLRTVACWLCNILAVTGAVLLIYHGCFDLSLITSPSMKPTLKGDIPHGGNDWVLTERVSYWFRKPKRWEVVRFFDDEGNQVMKRIVGLPGEKVQIEDEFVIINGKKLDRPASLWFLTYYGFGRSRNGAVMECKDGYFVLGDDSRDSNDSRYEGPIEPRWIRGRAWLRVWPWERMGFVNP